MITRHLRRLAGSLFLVLPALATLACERVPLTAPTGSSITLTSATTVLPANGTATIVATVIEAAGTPPHSGTQVSFTTTLGTIEPADASTDTSGRAIVTFRANGASGVAIIAASSGGATTSSTGSSSGTSGGTGSTGTTDRSLRITIGTAAVGRVIAAANPAILPVSGGVSTIVATVLDINSNPLSSATVTFSTTAGTLSSAAATTDGSGNASVNLTTTQSATVTATAGLGSSGTGGTGTGGQTTANNQATVAVTLKNAPSISIDLPSPAPSQGLPANYTFKATPATSGGGGTGTGGGTATTTAIKDVVVDWGDGRTQSLGAISTQIVSHTYNSAQTYLINATVTDVAGESARVSTAVSVIPVPQLAVVVTPVPQTAIINGLITFNILVTVPAGLSVQDMSINFGDGEIRQLGGATSVSVTKSYATAGARTVTVTVLDTIGRATIGTAAVNITP